MNASSTHLRTYSRRVLRRRHTSPILAGTDREASRYTNYVQGPYAQATYDRFPSQLAENTVGRRPRCPVYAEENKTPTDLAWDALASSAPVLVRHDKNGDEDDKAADGEKNDGRPDLRNAIGGRRDIQSHMDPIVDEDTSSQDKTPPNEMLQEEPLRRAVSGHERPDGLGFQESDDGAGRENQLLQRGFEHMLKGRPLADSYENDGDVKSGTARKTPTAAGRAQIRAMNERQTINIRDRFLIFDKAPPQGFKIIQKRQAGSEREPTAKEKKKEKTTMMNNKRLSDGFSDNEARPILLGKRRRLYHLETDIGSLDLTQRLDVSAQRQKSANNKLEQKPPPSKTARIRRGQHFYGTSQFEVEPQDPMEPDWREEEPAVSRERGLDKFCCERPSHDKIAGFTVARKPPPQAMLDAHAVDVEYLILRPDPLSWPQATTRRSELALLGHGIQRSP